MRTQTHSAVILTISAALLAPQATVPVQAQTIAPNAEAGRIVRFLSPTKLGNSVLFRYCPGWLNGSRKT
jgi:hypothetical protein